MKILILGASARAAASSAARANYELAAVDLFADLDLCKLGRTLRILDYPLGFEDAANALPASPWMYTGALENHPDLIDRIALRRPLLGNSGVSLRRLRDPFVLAETFRLFEIPYPEVSQLAPVGKTGVWLRKPTKSAGGWGIDVFSENNLRLREKIGTGPGGSSWELAGETSRQRGRPTDFYYQRFVPGRPCSAVYLAAGGRAVLLGATEQLISQKSEQQSRFRYFGSVGPLSLTGKQQAALEAIGNCLASQFTLSGLVGVDVAVEGDKVCPIEVNPRYTASVEVLERSLGFGAVALHAAACQNGGLPAKAKFDESEIHGKQIIHAEKNSIINQEFVQWTTAANANLAWPVVADIPRKNEAIKAGRPITTVYAHGEDLASVRRNLEDRSRVVLEILKA